MNTRTAAGYIVASRVYYEGLQPVMIQYTAQNGSTVTYTVGSSWNYEYSYSYVPPALEGYASELQ